MKEKTVPTRIRPSTLAKIKAHVLRMERREGRFVGQPEALEDLLKRRGSRGKA